MTLELPRLVLLDPPWKYNDRRETRKDNPGKKAKFGIGVQRRYITMTPFEMGELRPLIEACTSPDAYMLMWAVPPMFEEAIDVIHMLGFDYKTIAFVWVKTQQDYEDELEWLTQWEQEGDEYDNWYGPGGYTPSNVELLLIARRPGHGLWHPNTGAKPRQVQPARHPRTPDGKIWHSRKPALFQDLLVKWLDPHCQQHQPPLELFATERKPGWTGVGWDLQFRRIEEVLPRLAKVYQAQDLRLGERLGLQHVV